jgi:hypothetical protein
MSLETTLYLIFISMLMVGAIYEFRKQDQKNRELNRTVEERIEREAAAKERSRIYNENYQREEKALRKRVLDGLKAADLLYPETLEDVEALKGKIKEELEKISHGESQSSEYLEAATALNEIRAREMRRCREEEETEEPERFQEKKQKEEQAKLMGEIMKSTAKNIARGYGLPEDAFEGMRPEEVAVHARVLRLSRQFAHLPAEEREARALE